MYDEIEDPEYLETATDSYDDDDEPYAERVIIFDSIDGDDEDYLAEQEPGDDERIAR